ncbi:MAG: hypothetical protein Q8P18_28230 [Pseudomonadota bacterium]|nr:hypothetical protein [Pseudomonadota bacterium]
MHVALSNFPGLESASRAASALGVDVDKSHVDGLLDLHADNCGDYDFPALESAFARLRCETVGHAALAESVSDLFQAQEAKYRKGLTEMLAFGHFAGLGLLREVGWPPGHGRSPPFEGRILLGGRMVAFDVKAAIENSHDLIQRVTDAATTIWEARTGGRLQIRFTADGLDGRARVGPTVAALRTQLSAHLAQWTSLPIPGLKFQMNGVHLRISFGPPQLVSMDMSYTDTASAAADAWSYIKRHIDTKGSLAARHGTQFALVYVQPSTAASADMRIQTFKAALGHAAGTRLPGEFLGFWFLRFTESPPSEWCWRYTSESGLLEVDPTAMR